MMRMGKHNTLRASAAPREQNFLFLTRRRGGAEEILENGDAYELQGISRHTLHVPVDKKAFLEKMNGF